MKAEELKREVLKKVEMQADACREFLVDWFKGPSMEDVEDGSYSAMSREDVEKWHDQFAAKDPTDEELDLLSWYVVAHMLNTDGWHDHNGWDEVLKNLRAEGMPALLREVKSEDGSYWTS
jgi:hypothetical protein